jgi:phosphomethylpyrimidine synthase
MTQLEIARMGKVSPEMEEAAVAEGVSAEKIRELIASGRTVIPKNKGRQFEQIMAIGEGLQTKVNAKIGTSRPCSGIESDRQISIYRRDLNWDGMLSEVIDPDWARERVSLSTNGETCTMCGEALA